MDGRYVIYPGIMKHNPGESDSALLPPFELGFSAIYLLWRGPVGVKSTSDAREQLESKMLKS